MDPRVYQIACLAGLLLYGLARLDFDVGIARVGLILATVLATQWACSRAARLPRFDPRSALISGLSLCLLLRADAAWLAAAAAVSAIGFGRALWLGQPLAAPIHRLENGALVFAFFMISDPKTTPDSRRGRPLLALLVALGANAVQFVLYRTSGLRWSLAAFSLLVPLIDRSLPGQRYVWSATRSGAVPIPTR